MFTMLVGIATYFFALGFIVFEKAVIAAILFFAAKKHGMNPVWWTVGGLLLDFWTLLLYFWVRHKMKNRKCPGCGAPLEESAKFCAICGNACEKTDDVKILKKFVFGIIIAIAGLSIISGILSAIIG